MLISCLFCFDDTLIQLIYDFRDGGGSFGFLSLRPENMPENELEEYKMIGFELHRLKLVIDSYDYMIIPWA